MTNNTPLLTGDYAEKGFDPLVLARVAKLLGTPTPVITPDIPDEQQQDVYKIVLGSMHQQLLERIYKANPLFYIALGHHRNTRGKRMNFKDRFLYQIYNDRTAHKIFRKCVQVGISEYMVVDAIYNSSVLERTLLYVLPTAQLSSTFVADRIEPSLRNTPYYKEMLTDGADNKTLKQFGTGTIYFTGAGSSKGAESQLFSSVPADDLRIDEYDRCALHIGENKLQTAYSRLKSAESPTIIECANPKAADILIDAKYKNSCQWVWAVKCEHCGKWQQLDWFQGVVRRINEYDYQLRDKEWTIELGRDISYYCQYCERVMNRFTDHAQWVALYPKRPIAGYHINRLMTYHGTIANMWSDFLKSVGNNMLMSLFYGDSLGIGYLALNAEINDAHVKQCSQKDYFMPDNSRNITVAGVDVHKIFLHVTIARPVGDKLIQVYIGKIINEDEIPRLFKKYSVGVACFDAMPETRMLKKLKEISSLKHIIYSVTFSQTSKTINTDTNEVSEDRTFAIDNVQNFILSHDIVFPSNIEHILDGEFVDQLTSSIRVSDVNEKGKPVEQWVCKPGRADHFLLSMAYQIIARDVMKKTFNTSSLDDMASTASTDIPVMAIPLFGVQTKDAVIKVLYNNLLLIPEDKNHYVQLIQPALREILQEEFPKHIKEFAEYWLKEYDVKYK